MKTLALILTGMIVVGLGAMARAGDIEIIDGQRYKRVTEEIVNIEITKESISKVEANINALEHEKQSCINGFDEKIQRENEKLSQYNGEIVQFEK